MARAEGFDWSQRKNGDVVIRHHGTVATTLRGRGAADFLDDIERGGDGGAQELMARLTGNHRRGNERLARRHPRHRDR
jgi:hypothetical protein